MKIVNSLKTACMFIVLTFSGIGATNSECGKAVRAETYLDTAVELIGKMKDNMPSEDDCKCPKMPADCSELLACGYNQSDVYKIWPRNRIMSGSIDVYCDMTTENGGWTVIQRRGNYKRPSDFFSKNWYKYKIGFGDPRRDFWLGNDNIYALTNQGRYYLHIDLVDTTNQTRYAFYDDFWIDNEQQHYVLHVYDYSGTAGDSFSRQHNGQKFSTQDQDNDVSSRNCAEVHKGGWWYTDCGLSNLNGLHRDEAKLTHNGLLWSTWKSSEIQNTVMKIRPQEFRGDPFDMDVELQ